MEAKIFKYHDVPESVTDITREVLSDLAISKGQLASLLMVTERSLYDWTQKSVNAIPPKGRRLIRLYQVIQELDAQIPKFSLRKDSIHKVLRDGRIPISETDEDGGDSMTLISYIVEFPDDHGWVANVKAAIQDYVEFVAMQKKRGVRV